MEKTARFKYLNHALTKTWSSNFLSSLRILIGQSAHTDESIRDGFYVKRERCN